MLKKQSHRQRKYDKIMLGFFILGIICGVLNILTFRITIIPLWIVLSIYFATGLITTIIFKRFYEWIDGKAHILLHLLTNLLIWSNIILFIFLGFNRFLEDIDNQYAINVSISNAKVISGPKSGHKVRFECKLDGIHKTLRYNIKKEDIEKYEEIVKSLDSVDIKINKGMFGFNLIKQIELKINAR
jgi:hypothetical protein